MSLYILASDRKRCRCCRTGACCWRAGDAAARGDGAVRSPGWRVSGALCGLLRSRLRLCGRGQGLAPARYWSCARARCRSFSSMDQVVGRLVFEKRCWRGPDPALRGRDRLELPEHKGLKLSGHFSRLIRGAVLALLLKKGTENCSGISFAAAVFYEGTCRARNSQATRKAHRMMRGLIVGIAVCAVVAAGKAWCAPGPDRL